MDALLGVRADRQVGSTGFGKEFLELLQQAQDP